MWGRGALTVGGVVPKLGVLEVLVGCKNITDTDQSLKRTASAKVVSCAFSTSAF